MPVIGPSGMSPKREMTRDPRDHYPYPPPPPPTLANAPEVPGGKMTNDIKDSRNKWKLPKRK